MKTYKNLTIIRKILDKYDIKIIFIFGTLIGMARDKKPISYDNGHDAVILEKDFTKFFVIEKNSCENYQSLYNKKLNIKNDILTDFKKK